MSEFDVVVAGAGHNSLVAAAYLARAGYEVCVLEARELIGGDTCSEELNLPGFVHDTCSTFQPTLMGSPVLRDDELGLLADYGLELIEPEVGCLMPFPDGTVLTQYLDPQRTWESIGPSTGATPTRTSASTRSGTRSRARSARRATRPAERRLSSTGAGSGASR